MWEAAAAGRRTIAPTSERGPAGLRWREVALMLPTAESKTEAEAGLRRRKSPPTRRAGDSAVADCLPGCGHGWHRWTTTGR